MILKVAVADVDAVVVNLVREGLLGVLHGLVHGRSPKCATLRELSGQLWCNIFVVRVNRVFVGVPNYLVKVLITRVGVSLSLDVLRPTNQLIQRGLLTGISG